MENELEELLKTIIQLSDVCQGIYSIHSLLLAIEYYVAKREEVLENREEEIQKSLETRPKLMKDHQRYFVQTLEPVNPGFSNSLAAPGSISKRKRENQSLQLIFDIVFNEFQ